MKLNLVLIVMMLIAVTAMAQQKRGPQLILGLDSNGDRQITREEWSLGWNNRYAKVDTNADGTVDQDEIQKIGEQIREKFGDAIQQRRTQMDADKDGKVSESEWKGGTFLFRGFDSDSDGYITSGEFSDNGPGSRIREHVQEMDTNQDGKISRQEFDTFHESMFLKFDRNGDGMLSAADRSAAGNDANE